MQGTTVQNNLYFMGGYCLRERYGVYVLEMDEASFISAEKITTEKCVYSVMCG